jgi:hypothetical protein
VLDLQHGFSLSAIARELTQHGILTATGGWAWTAATAVRNVLARETSAQ